jgi:Pyruvate/2-oxoacid:ferredoxin oxidoreductase gamma subunit
VWQEFKRGIALRILSLDRKGEQTMKQKVINVVMQGMLAASTMCSWRRLQEVLEHALFP